MLFKYPRTFHLPWSEGVTDDDKSHKSVECFSDMDIVVSVKMDGENTSMYRNKIHARSLDSVHHPSRNWVKMFWNAIKNDIPKGFRICGENLYATHSIHYTELKSYFYGFSVWDEDLCLGWQETLEWFDLLSIRPVEVIYEGKFDEVFLRELAKSLDKEKNEGYVIRNKNSFKYEDFSKNVGKYVRKNHVQTDEHWMKKAVTPNELKG